MAPGGKGTTDAMDPQASPRRVAFDDAVPRRHADAPDVPASPPVAPAGEDGIAKQLELAEEQVALFHKHMNLASEAQSQVRNMSMALEKEIRALPKDDKRRKSLEQRWKALRDVLPQTRSFFSRIMLGRVNLKVRFC